MTICVYFKKQSFQKTGILIQVLGTLDLGRHVPPNNLTAIALKKFL